MNRKPWRTVRSMALCCLVTLLPFSLTEAALADLFAGLDWITFAPTNFDPTRELYPNEASLHEDLRVLCGFGFRGIITYGSWRSLKEVPRLAREECFRGVVMGIWCVMPRDGCTQNQVDAEFDNAVAASPYVDSHVVGNEGLGPQYDRAELEAAMTRLKAATGKPVTTSEQLDDYVADPSLLALGDFVLPIVHPFWHGVRSPHSAAAWTADQYQRLKAMLTERGLGGKALFFKEVGLPTAGCAECSEDNQAIYYHWLSMLRTARLLLFAYFEAFDQPWKTGHAVEPHWGLLRADRSPKKILKGPRLSVNLTGCMPCRAGDVFSATGDVANPSTRNLEAKLGFYFPDRTPVRVLPDRHLELPPGFTFHGEVLRLTVPPGLPPGDWQFGGRLLESELGETPSESFKDFRLQ